MSRPSPTAHRDQGGLDLAEHTLSQLPGLVARSGWTPPSELPYLKGVKRIAIDTETCDPTLTERGPGFRTGAYIVGLTVAVDDGPRWYFPTRHQGGGNLDEGLVKRWAREELGGFTGEVVGANLGYDLDGLATTWDVHLTKVSAFHDVQVAETLIDEWRLEYNLDALSNSYLGEGKDEDLLREAAAFYGAKTPIAVKKVLWRLPAAAVGPYGEADGDRPLRIFKQQEEILKREGMWESYNEVDRQLVPILVAMRRRGVRIDVSKAEALRVRLVKERDEWVRQLKHLAGAKAELNEAASLGPALEAAGIFVPKTPKSGQYSVTKPFLEKYEQVPLVRALLTGRKIDTVINTFIDSQILGYNVNGRVHPTFNQSKGDAGGTIGRFSGSDPNMQFIPARDEELAPLVRGIFIPEDGEEWQRDDASQIEYRFLADCAVGQGADEARAAYQADPKTDFHKMCAAMLGADPEDKVRRKRVKNTNFCKVYGGGIPKIAATFNCSEEEAAEFVKEYDESLPFVNATYQAAMKWANKTGYVTTVLGRKQHFPFWEPFGNYDRSSKPLLHDAAVKAYGTRIQRAFTYTALNKKLQISAAEAMKKGMVDAWNAGVCDVIGPFLITVHDELDNSVPRTKAGDEAGREVTRCMEQAVKLRVPVLVERDRGESWGECS